MSAPGIARITGFENGVWTVPSADEARQTADQERNRPDNASTIRKDAADLREKLAQSWGVAASSDLQRTLALVERIAGVIEGNDGVQLVSIEHPTEAEQNYLDRLDINPQSTETIEIELGSLAILNRLAQWAALKNGENIIIDGIDLTNINNWGDCLHDLLVDTIAQIRALEAENQDLRTDITIMGNVLDDYAGRR